MPNPDQITRLRDMLQACRDVQEHTRGLSQEQFLADKTVYHAVLWNITVIGEAANHLTDTEIEERLDIPWGAVISMRNRLVHSYWLINPLIIWNVVETSIARLIPQLVALEAEIEKGESSDA